LFLPFRFKHFLFGIFFFSSRRKGRKKQKKKNHKEEKKCKEGKEITFLLLLSPFHIPSMLSSSPSSSLCVTFHGSFVLLKLRSSPELWRCEGNRRGEVGRRGGSR